MAIRYFAVTGRGTSDGTSVANAAPFLVSGALNTIIKNWSYTTEFLECRILHGTYLLTETIAAAAFTNNPVRNGNVLFVGADEDGERWEPPAQWNACQPVHCNLLYYLDDLTNAFWSTANGDIEVCICGEDVENPEDPGAPMEPLDFKTLDEIELGEPCTGCDKCHEFTPTSSTAATFFGSGNIRIVSGQRYTIWADVKDEGVRYVQLRMSSTTPTSGYANFDLQEGILGTVDTGINASIEELADGYYRCKMDFECASTGEFAIRLNCIDGASAARNATYSGGDGTKHIKINDVRFEFGFVTKTSPWIDKCMPVILTTSNITTYQLSYLKNIGVKFIATARTTVVSGGASSEDWVIVMNQHLASGCYAYLGTIIGASAENCFFTCTSNSFSSVAIANGQCFTNCRAEASNSATTGERRVWSGSTVTTYRMDGCCSYGGARGVHIYTTSTSTATRISINRCTLANPALYGVAFSQNPATLAAAVRSCLIAGCGTFAIGRSSGRTDFHTANNKLVNNDSAYSEAQPEFHYNDEILTGQNLNSLFVDYANGDVRIKNTHSFWGKNIGAGEEPASTSGGGGVRKHPLHLTAE